MQMDSPMLVAAADVVPQDVSMVDNDSKTFLFLRLQGSTEKWQKKNEINDYWSQNVFDFHTKICDAQ